MPASKQCKEMVPCDGKKCRNSVQCTEIASKKGYCCLHGTQTTKGKQAANSSRGNYNPGVETHWNDPNNNPLIPQVGKLSGGHTGTNWLGTQVNWT